MKITLWPLTERPREKLFRYGVKALTDAELVAILLRLGTKGKTALDLARELLAQYGSLKKLLDAHPHHLAQLSGIGKAKCAILKAALELGYRCLEDGTQIGEKLASSLATQRYLAARLRAHTREVFACLFLTNHHQIIAFEELFQGTLTEANVYPREIVKTALAHNAAKVILAHNHPSGNPNPSQADKDITRHVKKILALVDIQVIDHIIIGQQENYSFAEAGLV